MGFEHLIKRTNQFALDCIDLCKKLPKTTLGKHINGQLIRASTSVAANYRASCKAYTKKLFLSKLSIVIEEADESEYWLGLIKDENLINDNELGRLCKEAHELASIFIQSRKTTIKNSNISETPPNHEKTNSKLHTPHSTLKNSPFKSVPFLDLKAQYQSIKSEIDLAISEIIKNTAFIQGNAVKEFEASFAKLIGVKNCIGVANGTDALIISIKSLGIGKGDEVIVPANSFVATSEAVTAAGARVVFVDNHPVTYNIDTGKIEEKFTSKTKAIIAVHLYGKPADMDPILNIAKKHNIFVIEDSAQGHLAEYQTKNGKWEKTGTFGDIATFSFYPGKNLGAYGDAGAIVTNNDELAKKARMFANHGRISKYNHEFEGYNSRMDGIQGAVLGVKLKHLTKWTQKRREAADYYIEKSKSLNNIVVPFVEDGYKPVWHLFVIRTKRRDELQKYLKENGISIGVHYPIALPNLNAYKYLNHSESDFPVASSYQNQLLSLPIFPEITNEQIQYVVDKIKEFFQK